MLIEYFPVGWTHRLYVQTNPYNVGVQPKVPVSSFVSRYIVVDEDEWNLSLMNGYLMEGVPLADNWLVVQLPASYFVGHPEGETRVTGYAENTQGERMILDPRLGPDDEQVKYYDPVTHTLSDTPPATRGPAMNLYLRGANKWFQAMAKWISNNWVKVVKLAFFIGLAIVIAGVLYNIALFFGLVPADKTGTNPDGTQYQHLVSCQYVYWDPSTGNWSTPGGSFGGAVTTLATYAIAGGIVLIVVLIAAGYLLSRPKVKPVVHEIVETAKGGYRLVKGAAGEVVGVARGGYQAVKGAVGEVKKAVT